MALSRGASTYLMHPCFSRAAALEHSHGWQAVAIVRERMSRVAAKEFTAATRLIARPNESPAFSRGYALTPLRG